MPVNPVTPGDQQPLRLADPGNRHGIRPRAEQFAGIDRWQKHHQQPQLPVPDAIARPHGADI